MFEPAVDEQRKYAEIWTLPDYRNYSPGLANVDRFVEAIRPAPSSTLVDLGAGACVAGLELARRGLDVWWLDITDAARPDLVPVARFIRSALWADWGDGRTWD
ncbi:hypothetical protein, partial [Pseudomonas fluorescens]|uniref:hypothetical protein n=1 Tax=Pseudomonas fluorescens TaxID=294 RepID=UPI001CA61326